MQLLGQEVPLCGLMWKDVQVIQGEDSAEQ